MRVFGIAAYIGCKNEKTLENVVFPRVFCYTPGRIRTCDLRIRNPMLYPTELQGLVGF